MFTHIRYDGICTAVLFLYIGFIGLCFLITTSCKTLGVSSSSVILRESDHEEAIRLREKIYELNEQGKYAEAIPMAKQLLEIVEAEKGPDHEGVAACLDVLGGLQISFGDHDKAKPILKRALEIHEKLEGRESPNVATSLGLLAKVYLELGDYSSAVPLAKRSLRIREMSLEKDDFMVSTSLNTLGEIYLNLHEFGKAEPLFLRAVEIRKEHENTHGLIIVLNNLCRLYYEIDDYASAEPLAEAALELGKSALGEDHPHLSETLNLLGRINAAIGRSEKSLQYLERAQEIQLQSIDNMKGFTSEKQKLRYLARMEEDLHVFLSLIFSHFPRSPEAVKAGLNIVLKRKGIILEVQKQFQQALVAGDERTLAIFRKLSQVRAVLSNMVFSGPGDEGLQAYREKMDGLRAEKERLEIRLSKLSNPYTLYLRKTEANCDNIAAALPEDSALIELISIRLFHFKATAKKKWGRSRYFAFILPAGDPDGVRFVELGETKRIDGYISSLKEAIEYDHSRKTMTALINAGQLYSRIFSPFEKELGKVRYVFLSPDGNLSLLPFEILRKPGGRFLVEMYTFNYVSSGRDILGFGGKSSQCGKPLVMGNPDFDLGIGEREEILRRIASRRQWAPKTRYSKDLRGMHFESLPGTEKEVQLISSVLGKGNIYFYTGKQALEEVLMQAESPRFLHLATHGFFLADQDMNQLMSGHSSRGLVVQQQTQPRFFDLENPLLRSGLALAGANSALDQRDSPSGIVTAEEILTLKLHGTEMVVLSACETGLGEVKVGEGVFGLRRAFTQAGAKGLVMSMWPVPDLETSELMIQFYKNIISGEVNRAEALRQAMLNQIQVVKNRYGSANPFYWGAFVFLGEP